MCLIIFKPAKAEIPISILRSAYEKNKDGWGLMRRARKGAFVRKGIGGFNEFIRNWALFKEHECAIHFRWSTCGKKDYHNAHPFELNPDTYMMHNGNIVNVPMYDNDKSDSYHYAELISPYVDLIREDQFQDILAMATDGQANKFCFMDKTGIFVPDEGSWYEDEQGILYSNLYSWDAPEVMFEKYHPEIIAEWKERQKLLEDIPSNDNIVEVENKDDLPYDDIEEYKNWWKKHVVEIEAIQAEYDINRNEPKYDREITQEERDHPSVIPSLEKHMAKEVDLLLLDRKEITSLCSEEPFLMAEVIHNVLAKM